MRTRKKKMMMIKHFLIKTFFIKFLYSIKQGYVPCFYFLSYRSITWIISYERFYYGFGWALGGSYMGLSCTEKTLHLVSSGKTDLKSRGNTSCLLICSSFLFLLILRQAQDRFQKKQKDQCKSPALGGTPLFLQGQRTWRFCEFEIFFIKCNDKLNWSFRVMRNIERRYAPTCF